MTDFTLKLGPTVTVVDENESTVLSPLKSVGLDVTGNADPNGPSGNAILNTTNGVLTIALNIPPGVGISKVAPSADKTKIVFTLSNGTTQSVNMSDLGMPGGVYVSEDGVVRSIPKTVGVLPSDVINNGGVYMVGSTALPTGLSVNADGSTIMTDGTVYYPGTYSNNGVLCALPG